MAGEDDNSRPVKRVRLGELRTAHVILKKKITSWLGRDFCSVRRYGL